MSIGPIFYTFKTDGKTLLVRQELNKNVKGAIIYLEIVLIVLADIPSCPGALLVFSFTMAASTSAADTSAQLDLKIHLV